MKIFNKNEAMDLKEGDVVCLWRDLDTNYPDSFNLIVYKIYSTRMDVYGCSRKNMNLHWKGYGETWLLSEPVNSFKSKNIKLEDILKFKKMLETQNEKLEKLRIKAYEVATEKNDFNKIDRIIEGIKENRIYKSNLYSECKRMVGVASDKTIGRWQAIADWFFDVNWY